MHNFPQHKLKEIVNQYGDSVCHDPKLCKALLKDFCGQYRKEISVLVGALEEGIPAELLESKDTVPHTVLTTQLIKKLQDNLGLTDEAARWAVESWVLALRISYSPASPLKLSGLRLNPRPLHVIWICDCSGSMAINGKIQALNMVIREEIPLMQAEANQNPSARVLVRAIKFSSEAQWHIAQPTPVEDFQWIDLTTDGVTNDVTDMGKALSMVAEQLKIPPMSDRALPPVLVLISDGQPTDNFSSGLRQLMEQPWGKKAVRIAIAVGGDADYETLHKFIGNTHLNVLKAHQTDLSVKLMFPNPSGPINISSPRSTISAHSSTVLVDDALYENDVW